MGFLEKKKDYKKRALDHQRKEAKMKSLRKKAKERNPDEFYFKMVNTHLEDGEHVEEEKPIGEFYGDFLFGFVSSHIAIFFPMLPFLHCLLIAYSILVARSHFRLLAFCFPCYLFHNLSNHIA